MERTRIALNGFGRIGRSITRILAHGGFDDLELVLVNDIAPLTECAYLFEYDSVFGPWRGSVHTEKDCLVVDGRTIAFTTAPDLGALDLGKIDIVLECTGMTGSRAVLERGLNAGARRVLVSGPSNYADATVVLGANDEILSNQAIVSNASCTTNAVAPLLKLIDRSLGVEAGQMTTVHCYTSSQPTVDRPQGDPARSRAAALSMVPTTSAGSQIDKALPQMTGRIEARAIRVPTASVSCIDLTLRLRDEISTPGLNLLLLEGARHSRVLGGRSAH